MCMGLNLKSVAGFAWHTRGMRGALNSKSLDPTPKKEKYLVILEHCMVVSTINNIILFEIKM